MFVTIVEGTVHAAREDDLRAGWDALRASGRTPDCLIGSSLLRATDGNTWRIVTEWDSPEAVTAMRASGEPPAAPRVFEGAGATPSLTMWTVEGRITT